MDAKVDTLHKEVNRIIYDTNISIDSLREKLDKSVDKIRAQMNSQDTEIKQAIETRAEEITQKLLKEIEASGDLLEQMIEQLRS